jgi:hypothetical protein
MNVRDDDTRSREREGGGVTRDGGGDARATAVRTFVSRIRDGAAKRRVRWLFDELTKEYFGSRRVVSRRRRRSSHRRVVGRTET